MALSTSRKVCRRTVSSITAQGADPQLLPSEAEVTRCGQPSNGEPCDAAGRTRRESKCRSCSQDNHQLPHDLDGFNTAWAFGYITGLGQAHWPSDHRKHAAICLPRGISNSRMLDRGSPELTLNTRSKLKGSETSRFARQTSEYYMHAIPKGPLHDLLRGHANTCLHSECYDQIRLRNATTATWVVSIKCECATENARLICVQMLLQMHVYAEGQRGQSGPRRCLMCRTSWI